MAVIKATQYVKCLWGNVKKGRRQNLLYTSRAKLFMLKSRDWFHDLKIGNNLIGWKIRSMDGFLYPLIFNSVSVILHPQMRGFKVSLQKNNWSLFLTFYWHMQKREEIAWRNVCERVCLCVCVLMCVCVCAHMCVLTFFPVLTSYSGSHSCTASMLATEPAPHFCNREHTL